ncbi:unnamed protein product [Adineta steineri]|uniref:Uncharacterized protein n=1 Tax=Adineta steineri TaxID=433720 RepID=A0A814KVX8_9BILA|nr:unnamed protein product [Adineta steineri]CAF3494817.1 unnamed protein product [Adineta steineri]
MKSIIMFYLLFILTIVIPYTFSYGNHKSPLYRLLQNPIHTSADTLALPIENDKDETSVIEQMNSMNEEQNHIQIRKNMDSDEYYYFKWASKNRRPIEFLTGRKREADKFMIPPRARRINGGLWRSGLVG